MVLMGDRSTIREIMFADNPAGFDARMPGKRKATIPRTALTSVGPFREISSDGHEKLAHLALRMGDLGFPIYAFKDKWSDFLLYIRVLPNARTLRALAHLFLDFIEEYGGRPSHYLYYFTR